MFITILQVITIVFVPWLLMKLTKRLGTENFLSPVVLCYVLGIVLCNFMPFELNQGISTSFSQVTIILAIPLLLYSTDLIGWFKLARSTIISFLLVIISVVIAALIVAPLFQNKLSEVWLLMSMLVGVFIGGTPNMNSVGMAMGADESLFIQLNATELICGGIYLIFLTSIAHKVYGLVLPKFDDKNRLVEEVDLAGNNFVLKEFLQAFALTLVIAAVSLGLTWLISGALTNAGLIILLISALSVGASFSTKIRNLNGAYEAGEYLLLMFCMAIGMMANLSDLFKGGGILFLFTGCSWLVALSLHLLLCRLFKIDRDTMMITQTAGFYGPPFIGQIAAVIHNRSLIFSGVMTGLVGMAVANFIGVGMGNLLKMWLLGQ